MRKNRYDNKQNSRLQLYLRLANLRRGGRDNYRELAEFRELATVLFEMLNGYTPEDDSWIYDCTWLP